MPQNDWLPPHDAPPDARLRDPCTAGMWECALTQPRCTGMLLGRIVSAENRMREMSDDHEQPNIDLEYLGARGILCNEAAM